jgi:RNA polymerase sigma-70 factor (ECF subfamily)
MKMTDEELVERAKKDIQVFSKIVERYEDPLLRYILRLSSFSREEGEEILQEVFIKAWKFLNGFDKHQKFSSWIYRIAHNQTISEFRKAKARGIYQKVEWNEELYSQFPDSEDLPKDFDRSLHSKKIMSVINTLPEKYKSVIILRFLEEKTYDEISDILCIPIGSAATLVNRAKNMLRKRSASLKNKFFS